MYLLYLQLRTWLEARVEDETGATMVEYGLLIALIAFVAAAALTPLGTTVGNAFNNIAGQFGAGGGGG